MSLSNAPLSNEIPKALDGTSISSQPQSQPPSPTIKVGNAALQQQGAESSSLSGKAASNLTGAINQFEASVQSQEEEKKLTDHAKAFDSSVSNETGRLSKLLSKITMPFTKLMAAIKSHKLYQNIFHKGDKKTEHQPVEGKASQKEITDSQTEHSISPYILPRVSSNNRKLVFNSKKNKWETKKRGLRLPNEIKLGSHQLSLSGIKNHLGSAGQTGSSSEAKETAKELTRLIKNAMGSKNKSDRVALKSSLSNICNSSWGKEFLKSNRELNNLIGIFTIEAPDNIMSSTALSAEDISLNIVNPSLDPGLATALASYAPVLLTPQEMQKVLSDCVSLIIAEENPQNQQEMLSNLLKFWDVTIDNYVTTEPALASLFKNNFEKNIQELEILLSEGLKIDENLTAKIRDKLSNLPSEASAMLISAEDSDRAELLAQIRQNKLPSRERAKIRDNLMQILDYYQNEIPEKEFLRIAAYGKATDKIDIGTPMSNNLITMQEALGDQIVDQILNAETASEALNTIKFYIQLADDCVKEGHLQAASVIYFALTRDSISRIIERNPEQFKSSGYQALQQLFSLEGNFINLRTEIENRTSQDKKVVVPFNIIIKDLSAEQSSTPRIIKDGTNKEMFNLTRLMNVQAFFSKLPITRDKNDVALISDFFTSIPFSAEGMEEDRWKNSLHLFPKKE